MQRLAFVVVGVCVSLAGLARGEPTQPAFLGIVAQELVDVVPRAGDRATLRFEDRVTRLDLSRDGTTAVARCEVSLLLLEMPGGSLRAILSGRSEVSGGTPDSLEERAVRSAVRRALSPLRNRLPIASR